MAIAFNCPNCNTAYKVKDDLAGKKAACKKCKHVMLVPAAQPAAAHVDSHALEALATAALGDETATTEAQVAEAAIKYECEFCFETVEFSADKAGKKSPCPSCRRIVTVPVPKTNQPKKDWRAVDHNLTMALKNAEAAPQDAWGNQQKSIVSREALVEAAVVEDRSKAGLRDWSKIFMWSGLGVAALVAIGFWWSRGKAADDRRMGLMVDAIAAAGPKAATALPPGWAAAIQSAAGEFYLGESDLKNATKHLQLARAAARQVESPGDRAALLRNVASRQTGLIGDANKIVEKKALDWEEAHRELRQTLQAFRELPREEGWLVLEELGRKLGPAGPDKPILMLVGGEALPPDSDRADAMACVGLANPEVSEKFLEEAKRVYGAVGEGVPAPRYAALLISKKQLPAARKVIPEPTGAEPNLNQRLAYAEGYARTGDANDLTAAKKVANAEGPVEHKVAAWCMLADGCGQPAELEAAVKYVCEQGQKFTLPSWPIIRLGEACKRANRGDLVRQLADGMKQANIKPWIELDALRTAGTVDAAMVDKVGDKSAAQAFAWELFARSATRATGGDPRAMVAGWSTAAARPLGLAGAALGLQDRGR
ncbi:MAG: hypothetical protein K1X57_07525 [Gemmataceae bacterium]|nr:hypothetical protein [Gemmataceae bacterium]